MSAQQALESSAAVMGSSMDSQKLIYASGEDGS
jgi:hypothetical protein